MYVGTIKCKGLKSTEATIQFAERKEFNSVVKCK